MRKQALAWSPSGLADVPTSTIQVPATELLTAPLPLSGIGLPGCWQTDAGCCVLVDLNSGRLVWPRRLG
jgi:hypothetical protein